MLSGADIHSKCPGNKTGNLDGQVCRGMPVCSDHSFLQSYSIVPLCSRGQLAVQETSALAVQTHISRNTAVCTQATFLFWGFTLGTANTQLTRSLHFTHCTV